MFSRPLSSANGSRCDALRGIEQTLFLGFLMFSMCFTPFAVFLEFDLALYELPILARPIVGAGTLLTSDFYELILRHRQSGTISEMWLSCKAGQLRTDGVPRTAERLLVNEYLHDEVDDEPGSEDHNKSDADVPEPLFGLARLARLASCRNVLPSCICEENRREKYGNIDADVERILRKLGDVTKIAVRPVARNDLGWDLGERQIGRDEDDEQRHEHHPPDSSIPEYHWGYCSIAKNAPYCARCAGGRAVNYDAL